MNKAEEKVTLHNPSSIQHFNWMLFSSQLTADDDEFLVLEYNGQEYPVEKCGWEQRHLNYYGAFSLIPGELNTDAKISVKKLTEATPTNKFKEFNIHPSFSWSKWVDAYDSNELLESNKVRKVYKLEKQLRNGLQIVAHLEIYNLIPVMRASFRFGGDAAVSEVKIPCPDFATCFTPYNLTWENGEICIFTENHPYLDQYGRETHEFDYAFGKYEYLEFTCNVVMLDESEIEFTPHDHLSIQASTFLPPLIENRNLDKVMGVSGWFPMREYPLNYNDDIRDKWEKPANLRTPRPLDADLYARSPGKQENQGTDEARVPTWGSMGLDFAISMRALRAAAESFWMRPIHYHPLTGEHTKFNRQQPVSGKLFEAIGAQPDRGLMGYTGMDMQHYGLHQICAYLRLQPDHSLRDCVLNIVGKDLQHVRRANKWSDVPRGEGRLWLAFYDCDNVNFFHTAYPIRNYIQETFKNQINNYRPYNINVTCNAPQVIKNDPRHMVNGRPGFAAYEVAKLGLARFVWAHRLKDKDMLSYAYMDWRTCVEGLYQNPEGEFLYPYLIAFPENGEYGEDWVTFNGPNHLGPETGNGKGSNWFSWVYTFMTCWKFFEKMGYDIPAHKRTALKQLEKLATGNQLQSYSDANWMLPMDNIEVWQGIQ